ncbi:transposase [Candidatus Bathyarchaeota archaeon]|nr:transposase [Candidatus Bathyarchaeota archaeon]
MIWASKAHVAMDVVSDMPVAVVGASANENEKKHAEELLDKASTVVEEIKAVVGDSQYSSRRVRDCIVEHGALPVIPYTSNQRSVEEGLRVDRFFRVSGPAEERRMYVGRAAVERVNSRLGSVGLDCLKLRGLRNAVVHMLLCVVTVLLVAVAALRLSRPWKAWSLSSFWW